MGFSKRIRASSGVLGVVLVALLAIPFAAADHNGANMPTFTGCLKTSGDGKGKISKVKAGQDPMGGSCPSGLTEVHLSGGDITGVTASTGLSGTATEGEATLSIDGSYRLPQGCASGEIPSWNGSSWACGTDAAGPGLPPYSNTTVLATGDVGYSATSTIGSDGLPIIAFVDIQAVDDYRVKVRHCGNIACTSGNITQPIDSSSSALVGDYMSIAIAPDGNPIITYHNSSPEFDLRVAHCGDVTCSSPPSIVNIDHGGHGVGGYTSVTIGSDGLPLIGSTDLCCGGEVVVTHCDNLDCTTSNSTEFGAGGPVSVAIGAADGMPLVAFGDGDGLEIMHCNDVACSGTGETIALIAAPAVPSAERLQIITGSDGIPVVVYRTNDNAVKVARCNGVSCGGASTVQTLNGGKSNPSIAVGGDGMPIVAYRTPDLRMVRCLNLGCTSFNEQIIDPGPVDYPNISLGVDGLPIVSFYATDTDDLKVIHCSNELCIPFYRRR